MKFAEINKFERKDELGTVICYLLIVYYIYMESAKIEI